MPFAPINGQRIYYEDSGGGGLPVILTHGFFFDHTVFDAQVAALAPAFRLIRWDERCFGRTEWDGRPFTLWDSAADALGLLEHLGVERAVVGGMSQGGFVSLRAALLRPERVVALLLFSTSAAAESDAVKVAMNQMAELWASETSNALTERVAASVLGPREHWEPWISRWRMVPKSALTTATRCLTEREDLNGRLGEISCPALVVHGTEDQLISIERARSFSRRLSGCKEMIEVAGAAHAPSITHADQVNPAVLEFLRRLG
jgi:pimeloyl-ACP methyl ester carboxylesterase